MDFRGTNTLSSLLPGLSQENLQCPDPDVKPVKMSMGAAQRLTFWMCVHEKHLQALVTGEPEGQGQLLEGETPMRPGGQVPWRLLCLVTSDWEDWDEGAAAG